LEIAPHSFEGLFFYIATEGGHLMPMDLIRLARLKKSLPYGQKNIQNHQQWVCINIIKNAILQGLSLRSISKHTRITGILFQKNL